MIKKKVKSVIILYDNKTVERSYGIDGIFISTLNDMILISSEDKIYLEFSKSIPHIIEYY